jgi:iron complex outermembrane receptor protein
MKKIVLLFVAVFLCLTGFSQNSKLVTTVVDENNETIPGVSVQVKEIKKQTGIDGQLMLELTPGTYTLVYKFAAYREITQTIFIEEGKNAELLIHMVPRSGLENGEIGVIGNNQ